MPASQILSLDKFLSNAHELVTLLDASQSHFILTKEDNAVAVVQGVKEHQKLLDALLMLKLIVQGEKDIQSGRVSKQEKFFKRLRQRLESKR
ncbi:type II toxin-antitoxin system Phd/YefM family antitoxin [candidate division KSB1 bacterium]|nr:type II toxin-antitoxin system Phd/YefM family antitoxin [candidate division KSB1 bacterium]